MNPGDMAQAAQSNDVVGALQKLILSRIPTAEQEADQRATRGRTMQEYQQELMTPSLPAHAPASMMLADMAANFKPGLHPMYAAGKGAKSGMDLQMKMDMADQAGRTAAAKVGFDEAKDIDKLGILELTALRGALGAGSKAVSPVVKMDKDGNMVVYDPITQKSAVVHASQRGEYQRIFSTAYKEAVDNGMKEPESYAHGVAQRVLLASPGYNPQDPSRIPQSPGAPAGVRPVPTVTENPEVSVPDGLDDRVYILMQEWVRNQEALRLASGNPSGQEYQIAQRNLGEIRKELKTHYNFDPVKDKALEAPPASAPQGTPMSSQDNRSMTYRDPRDVKSNEGYGSEEGKGLYKEYENMNTLLANQTKMQNQLALLRRIYSDPNIPEGVLGGYIHQLQSGLKSLGFDLPKSMAPADMAAAISTNMALASRTADGGNLMPGSMTTYEEKLLAAMSPTLSLTQEGRIALVDYMEWISAGHRKIAEAAIQAAKNNNDQLPRDWPATKARLLERYRKMVETKSRELMEQYGVKP